MKYKVGDKVRVKSKVWFYQEGNGSFPVYPPANYRWLFSKEMLGFCSKVLVVADFRNNPQDGSKHYVLDGIEDGIEDGFEDWMLDLDFDPCEPLPIEEAIVLMVQDGCVLEDSSLFRYSWIPGLGFMKTKPSCDPTVVSNLSDLVLYHKFPREKRYMSKEEAIKWAASPESHGWMVSSGDYWSFPSAFQFNVDVSRYKRAKINASLFGVDESTICGFEVEE
jgi:hypothetical protein